MDIIDILIDPITKSKLTVKDNRLHNLENTNSYEFSNNFFKLIPQKLKENNYIEHYEKDGEVYDYFQNLECKATAEDWKRLRQTILSKINFLDKNSIVIDVGSGGGWAAEKLVDKCGKFICIDVSEINLSKLSSIYQQDNFFVIQADAMNMPIADNSVDYIISSEVIEHLPNPEKFINEMFRILKLNGKIIISTPYKEKIISDLCIHCNKPTPRNSHLHSFDENNLLQLTKNCHNSEVKFHTFGNKVLHFGRCYIFLQFLPLELWHFIDKSANFFINKRLHIIMTVKKQRQ